jgi:hypothetical protein
MVARAARLVVDARNAIEGTYDHVFKLGAPNPHIAARACAAGDPAPPTEKVV